MGMGIGDWGLGIGDWGLGIGDWAQSPIPNPQSPIPRLYFSCHLNILNKYIRNFKASNVSIKFYNSKSINKGIRSGDEYHSDNFNFVTFWEFIFLKGNI